MSYLGNGFQTERKDTGKGKKFYGKYRAIVSNNKDTKDRMGRIKVKCPKVLGTSESNWCVPCFPFGGKDKGIVFMPKVGDTVWIEFEEGDPNLPIWVGNWYGLNEMPNRTTVYGDLGEVHVIETEDTLIIFNDKTKTLTLKGNTKVVVDCDLQVNGNINASGTVS